MQDLCGMVQVILKYKPLSRREAQAIVDEAKADRSELLHYLIHHYDVSESEVYERAADFFGLPFFHRIPRLFRTSNEVPKIDYLAGVTSVRGYLEDQTVIFLSTDADRLMLVGAHRRANPSIARQICVVPPSVLQTCLIHQHEDALSDHARQSLTRYWPHASAHLNLTKATRVIFVALLLTLVALALIAPFNTNPVPAIALMIIFLPGAWMRITALVELEERGEYVEPPLLVDDALPVYSVLIPLRDEAGMVPQLVQSMRSMDYPRAKLDIIFVVEETSRETVHAILPYLALPEISLIEVPKSAPHTKPKALNFALPFAKGQHVVVFDAEDMPEPDQLRKAATSFALSPEIDCLQAELTIHNGQTNWLTGLFAAEYSGLFGIMVPALSRWEVPVPLGGTSNHFRTSRLREIGAWDAFNVTEDADLGLRLARRKMVVSTLDSRTLEEAPIAINAWLRQRTRWMKGWMQTFAVHNRHPISLFRDLGLKGFLAFQFYVGGMILSAPLHLVFSIIIVSRLLVATEVPSVSRDDVEFIYLLVFVLGYIGTGALSIAGAIRLQQIGPVFAQMMLPVYWALVGVSAFRAMWELVRAPHHWHKTRHGLAKMQKPATPQAQQRNGAEDARPAIGHATTPN